MVIQCANIDVYIRMRFRERLESFRSCDNAQEPDILAAVLLQLIDCVDCGSAGRKHRIDDEHVSLLNICRKLAVVFDRGKRFRITVETDVSDFCRGKQGLHSRDHAETCAKDRNDRKLFAAEPLTGGIPHRCRYRILLKFKISRCLVAFKRRDFPDHLAEILRACLGIADNSDFVLNERMFHNKNFSHVVPPYVNSKSCSRDLNYV